MSVRPALVLTLAMVTSACALVPTQPRPGVALNAAAAGLAEALTPTRAPEWWRSFGDPQLDLLMTRALADSPALAEALARLQRAEAAAAETTGGRGLQVVGAGEVTRERLSAASFYPPPYAGASIWNGDIAAQLSWNLDFWGRQRALVAAAGAAVRVRELNAKAAAVAVTSSLGMAYVDLDRDHSLADVAAEVEQTRGRIADLTQRRLAAGLDTAVDLKTVEARLPEARIERANAEAGIARAVHALAALSGQGAMAHAAIARPHLTGAPEGLPDFLPADLLLRRADVAAGLARIESSTSGEEAARLAAYPDINLRAFAGVEAFGLADLVSAPARTYGIGPTVSLPIFDSGVLRARLAGAHAELDTSIAAYNATVLAAVRDVADRLTALADTDRGTREREASLRLLDDAWHLADKRFKNGVSSQLGALEARLRVLGARRALIVSRADALNARIALVAALGGDLGTSSTAPSAKVHP